MSGVKREMERLDHLERQAMGLLLETGAVGECPVHSDIYIDQFDDDAVDEARKKGAEMVKGGEVDGTKEEFMKAIENAVTNTGDECGLCAKNMDD
jgi:hypothetical protein